jgi:LytS/YehU family sensor histidine kinase
MIWIVVHAVLLQTWQFSWTISFTDAIVSSLLLAAICLLVSNNLRFYRPRKGKYLYVLVICVVASGLWIAIIQFILSRIFKEDDSYMTFLHNASFIRYTIALLVTGCMCLVSELWYTLEEYKETEQRSKDATQLAKEAELSKLRQQLQPHFLFNSLNSISALVTLRPDQARKMIQQLSDFLRGTLKKEENLWITLEEELQHLALYLDIEKVRFGHRLHTVIQCEAGTGTHRIPHMILQPLVENAIKFGLYDTTGAVTISIETSSSNQFLQIVVQNPFDPETSSPKQGTGFGLNAVYRRLYLLFSRNDLLSTNAENNLFTTTVKIPHA